MPSGAANRAAVPVPSVVPDVPLPANVETAAVEIAGVDNHPGF